MIQKENYIYVDNDNKPYSTSSYASGKYDTVNYTKNLLVGATYSQTNTFISHFGGSLDELEINHEVVIPNSPTSAASLVGKDVKLEWNSISDATGYKVYRSLTSGEAYELQATFDDLTTNWTDTTVAVEQNYYYVITAINEFGESPNSNEVSATPTAPQPTNQLKLVLEVKEEKQLSVSDELSVNTEMDWTSFDPTIATVDINGMVKALKPGNTVITCTSKDKSYTESINVLVVDLDYQLAVDLTVGGTCRLPLMI